eukprot:TRINITY_DN7107_c0_g2_i6.p1 TRINITY_DN7107_c0_g2~~TRINITY_DN7107_c0_g2_i6.p1  ORF type:complete len:202 (+),score=43.02 TRINITY_DN7107_c0_g2_i6:214-819(+)
MNSAYDRLLKFILIGAAEVEKSKVLALFGDAKNLQASTIGVDFRIRTLQIDDRTIKIQCWDTAGQDRFRSITTSYYRGAQGILLMYDISKEQSFLQVSDWLSDIQRNAADNVSVCLIGVNSQENETSGGSSTRVVESARGQAFVEEHNLAFFMEVNSKTGANVDEAFRTLAQHALANIMQGEDGAAVQVQNHAGPQQSGCC